MPILAAQDSSAEAWLSGADSKRALVSVSDKTGLDDLAKVCCNFPLHDKA